MTVRRSDFRQVKPTDAELAEWARKNPRRRWPPDRAAHEDCGKRIWYSGIAIGSHLRACKASTTFCACGCSQRRHAHGTGACFDCYLCRQFEAREG